MDEPPATTTVLYVAGWVHSGTTLLGTVLGQLDGFFCVGEARFLWRRLARGDRRCGCGAEVRECPTWAPIVERAFGSVDRAEAARIERLGESVLLNRRLPLVAAARLGRGPLAAPVQEYRAMLVRLYRTIAAVTGSLVIVDTSKTPVYAWLLEGLPGIDLRIVHVVRDPRGSLFSKLRREPGARRHEDVLLWSTWNVVTELLWRATGRYALVRYEDLARAPKQAFARIAGLAGQTEPGLPFVRPDVVALRPTHTVGGNEQRFRVGEVEISPDEAWRRGLRGRALAEATALTWPLLARYGYLKRRDG